MIQCKHKAYRSKKSIKYEYCRLKRESSPSCQNCKQKEFKETKPLQAKSKLKVYSKKRSTMEKQRQSIFTTDLKTCIENKDHKGHIDLHEIYEGKNRFNSMKYAMVIPVCRTCHQDDRIIKKWQVIGRKEFIKKYSEELFIKEFQTRKGNEQDE